MSLPINTGKLRLEPSQLWPNYLYLYMEQDTGNGVRIATFDCGGTSVNVKAIAEEIVARWPANRYEVEHTMGEAPQQGCNCRMCESARAAKDVI